MTGKGANPHMRPCGFTPIAILAYAPLSVSNYNHRDHRRARGRTPL